MLFGVIPQKLKRIKGNTKENIKRFYTTCIGWIRYKPLLLYITDRRGYEENISRIRKDLEVVVPKLSQYYEAPQFMKILDELDKYDKNVIKHYEEFEESKQSWQSLLALSIY